MKIASLEYDRYGILVQPPPKVFDHQVSGTFGECERRAYYQFVLGRQVVGLDRTAVNWGSAFHAMAEVWENTHSVDAIGEAIVEHLDENIDDRYGRTRDRMYEAALKWIEFRRDNPIKVLRTEQSTAVTCELGDKCPYSNEGCGLTYGGRMDEVVNWQSLNGPLDLKTTVMDEQDPVSIYALNHQFEGYVWIASHLEGQHCWGLIVERIVTNKSKIKIDRFPISYTRDQIREWVQNEQEIQRRYLHQLATYPTDETKWLQNLANCASPWNCSFRDVCLAPTEGNFRAKWLRDNTILRPWDFSNMDNKDIEGKVP